MSNITLKRNWVYGTLTGERVRIAEVILREPDNKPVSYQDTRGISYHPDGMCIDLGKDADLVTELFECHGKDDQNQICFYESDYYFLSSFSSFSVVWKGIRFDTLEYAYHYEKFDSYPYFRDDPEKRKRLSILRGQIRRAASSHDAFKLGQTEPDLKRPDWDSKEGKVRTMFMLIIEKVKQHEYVSRKIVQTHGRRLVEDSHRDSFWGWGTDKNGLNVLGQLWMLVREIVDSGLLYLIDSATFPLGAILVSVINEPDYDLIANTSSKDVVKAYIESSKLPLTVQETMIKVPLPAGMEDTPDIRQKLHNALVESQIQSNNSRSEFVDVGRFPIGGESS